jgi:hypothetical protein
MPRAQAPPKKAKALSWASNIEPLGAPLVRATMARLLGLAWIGAHERHPAVAQADMHSPAGAWQSHAAERGRPSPSRSRRRGSRSHGSSRTGRPRLGRSSAAHRPPQTPPGSPSTNWPRSAARHRSRRHSRGCATPRRSGRASGVPASAAGHSRPASRPGRTARDLS